MITASKLMHCPLLRPSLVWLLLLFSITAAGCTDNQRDYYQGYAEGEYMQVASPFGGRLKSLSVSRGMTVAKGDTLFILDRAYEAAAVTESEQGLSRAENKLADLSKGVRPSEIAAIEARLNKARSAYALARTEYERRQKLFQKKVIAQEVVDRMRSEKDQGAALVAQLNAEFETARLGARPDKIAAARNEVQAARERLTQARWVFEQKKQTAAQAGLVFDTFYVEGEFVPAAYPVVSILPPGNIKIRFFVPEPAVGTLALGQSVSVTVDGTDKPYRAVISYISPRAEYTPPVIYSRESRSHLVFMVEARTEAQDAGALHPGQPVDVRLEPPNA